MGIVNQKQSVPSKGMASDTWGRLSVRILWKTVSESRIVTPEKVG